MFSQNNLLLLRSLFKYGGISLSALLVGSCKPDLPTLSKQQSYIETWRVDGFSATPVCTFSVLEDVEEDKETSQDAIINSLLSLRDTTHSLVDLVLDKDGRFIIYWNQVPQVSGVWQKCEDSILLFRKGDDEVAWKIKQSTPDTLKLYLSYTKGLAHINLLLIKKKTGTNIAHPDNGPPHRTPQLKATVPVFTIQSYSAAFQAQYFVRSVPGTAGHFLNQLKMDRARFLPRVKLCPGLWPE